MAGSVYKALMGKEDCDVQDDELYPSTFSRLNSAGSTISLTSFPDIWKTHQGTVNAKYYGAHTQVGATLNAAVGQTVNNSCKAIYLDAGEWTIEADYDWSSYTDVYWVFAPGAYLNIPVAYTLTLPSPSNIIASPSQQIFSGSGTVAFSLPGTIHPAWYGTPKNGSTTATSYFNAINTSMAAGSIIELEPDANYYLNTASGVTFSKKVYLRGFGAKFTIGTTNGNGPGITVSAAEAVLENFEVVGDLTNSGGSAFDGSEDLASTNLKRAIKITGADVACRNLELTDCVAGIEYNAVDQGEVTGCKFTNASVTAGDGIGASCSGLYLYDSDYIQIHANRFSGYSNPILLGLTSNYNEIYANRISDCDNNGIYVSSGHNNKIFDNDIQDFDDSGIKARGSYNNIHHNDIRSLAGGSATGITVTGTGTPTGDYNGYHVQVNNNNLYGSFTYAIEADDNSSGYIRDPHISDNVIQITGGTGYGIIVNACGADGLVIIGNRGYGISAGIILQAAVGKYIDNALISDNNFPGGSLYGFSFTRVRYSTIVNNKVPNYNRAGGTDYGINMIECTYNQIRNNDCGDHQAVPTMNYGINEDSACSNNIIWGNYLSGVTADGLVLTGVSGTCTIPNEGETWLDSSGGAVDATLPDGDSAGQIVIVRMKDASNASTLTVTTHVTSSPEVFTFNATEDTLILMWTGREWTTIDNQHVAV